MLLPYKEAEEDEVLFIAEEVEFVDMTVDELLAKSRANLKDRLRPAGAALESPDEASAGAAGAAAASLEEPSAGAAEPEDPSAGAAGAAAVSLEAPSAGALEDEPSTGAAGAAGAGETTPDPKL